MSEKSRKMNGRRLSMVALLRKPGETPPPTIEVDAFQCEESGEFFMMILIEHEGDYYHLESSEGAHPVYVLHRKSAKSPREQVVH